MFSKKPHSDIKKSSQKVLDGKKDSLSRLKHLRIVLDNSDVSEAKLFFENNYSHIYYIFYDVFISVEASLKQRVHRGHKDELDAVCFIFEKILILLPELLSRRWQFHSIQRLMKKLLHPGNSIKVRKEGLRLFLMWYQILGENASDELDAVFSSLVPGIHPGSPSPYLREQGQSHRGYREQSVPIDIYQETSTFYALTTQDDGGPVCPGEILPILPSQSGEHQPENVTLFFLDCLMEFMVSQVSKIEWKDKSDLKLQKCFQFLFEKFKKYYLPHVFPNFSWATNLYKPLLDLPILRHEDSHSEHSDTSHLSFKETLLHCQSVVIRWFTHFAQVPKKAEHHVKFPERCESRDSDRHPTGAASDSDISQSSSSLPPAASYIQNLEWNSNKDADFQYKNHINVRETLYSNRENINLVHEVFRQAFLMPFTHFLTMRKVVVVYKDWIQKDSTDKPTFLEEPTSDTDSINKEDSPRFSNISLHSLSLTSHEETESSNQEPVGARLRKDSYLKAIQSDTVKAGLQNMLQVFVTNAANVFLLEIAPDRVAFLEEQVEVCKRVLNIYRYMVMNIPMERKTWEQLLKILLQITSLVLKEIPPARKETTLGGRLAPALFQTLIVTWIKANLNVLISVELWDQFLSVLSSLTQWEELINEWAKTLEILTRVLAKQVYNLDLNDLPLFRLSEQKQKKQRGMKKLPLGPSIKNDIESRKKDGPSSSPSIKNRDFQSSSITTDDDSSLHSRGLGQGLRTRSDSGDAVRKRSVSPLDRLPSISRSASDSHINKKGRYNHIYRNINPSIDQKHPFAISGVSPSVDEELASYSANSAHAEDYQAPYHKRLYSRQKSKSLDFLSNRAESPCFSESSEYRSRSPSPTPSSGMENTSIKDSPMQIDVLVSSTDNSCNNSEIGSSGEPKSVMSGGAAKGWFPDVSVVLWRRMLGSLGDINAIKDPVIHAQVFRHLVDFTETLIKVRDNLGVSLDNQSSPPAPEYIPPLQFITPWLFQAVSLPPEYHEGKILAYKLLSLITVRKHDLPLPKDYLTQFYKTIHNGIASEDQKIINTIVESCGPKFFAVNLPASTLLLLDFIYASDKIALSNELKDMPRTEAMSVLGSLLCFPNASGDMTVLRPGSTSCLSTTCKDAKDYIVSTLLKAGKREPAGLARCIALSSLGIYICEELMHNTNHGKIKEAINVLLTAVMFNNKLVSQVASDMLLLLCDHADILLEQYPDIPCRIIEVLSSSLCNLLPTTETPLSEEDKKLNLSLIFCLGEWCMHLPLDVLTQHWGDNRSPLLSVFKVLNSAVLGESSSTQFHRYMADISSNEIDPNIHLDNFQEGTSPAAPSPEKNSSNFKNISGQFQSKTNANIVQLAARSVMSHLVNHLGHFPMGIGATRLTSLVNEHDDVPTLKGDELSSDVFHAPNIQFFVLNNCGIISFVEIPALDVPGGGPTAGLTTAKSQVRLIVRDTSGKFSWDCSILYGPPECSRPSYAPPDVPVYVKNSATSVNSINGRVSEGPLYSMRHRSADILPTFEDSAEDLDNLDDLLQYIGHTSPECITHAGQHLNSPPLLQSEGSMDKEIDTMNIVLNQWNFEQSQLQKQSGEKSMAAKAIYPPSPSEALSAFQHCRLLLDQLGLTSWEKRSHFDLLKKNEKLLRELRNLDNQKCRETHKIAVIYVGEGQEDKNSLLLNCGGSQDFEEFVSGLGWEVELETHVGFLGGLQKNRSTGDTAPYFATSFMEVIFHVSTRMPASADDEAINKKLRHLGNDEVHIVWSEHSRDYRRGIIATEFCDVLIVIYPLGNCLYRISISRKPEVPYFGPLFNGAIVDRKILPGLVRATAINASKAKRSLIRFYQNFFEERCKSLETIVQNHKDLTTFENFASSVYSPAPPKSQQTSRISGSITRSEGGSPRGTTNLAAALLDSHSQSNFSSNLKNRPLSLSAEGTSPHGSPQSANRGQQNERPLSTSHSHTSSPLSHH